MTGPVDLEASLLRWVRTFALGLALCGTTPLAAAQAAGEEPTFPTAEAALAAVAAAGGPGDREQLQGRLGSAHRGELLGGDPAAVRQGMAVLKAAAAQDLRLVADATSPDRMTVILGRQAWPMPIPLVKDGTGGWRFDTAAGIDEIVDRRIGRNELTAIGVARTYVDAQQAYAAEDHDGDQVLEYAQKLTSTPGQRDGLYWAPGDDGAASPLAEFAAQAADYLAYRQEGEPYRGYQFRILTAQGANPPGGAYDYVINGNMIAGFALLAWPADYGNSGIMTFAVSHQGKVYQKDLGPGTDGLAEGMTRYDPDASWTEVSEEPLP